MIPHSPTLESPTESQEGRGTLQPNKYAPAPAVDKQAGNAAAAATQHREV
eukprot:CAMPEP_0184289040 /NCGR_PEP_ID=MMETSP1049-20130417/1522_1 /TAXON_ID=77928 /ORGANISM="Proteomonas sulcata, Strain CCMP704" /LENGTH=49 /DNA_ID=CAMNT_0026595685 /DNA_START=368 /DNA_END=517 /DNA_ORIENTATION=-